MLTKLYTWLLRTLTFAPARLAIARRYTDANGHYVGELYLEEPDRHGYRMIGASLDSLPLGWQGGEWRLDADNDFLAPMPEGVVRIGSQDPGLNDAVRLRVAKLSRWNTSLLVQNNFIEHVLERKTT